MIAYIDASALLRVVLGQPDALSEWASIERGVSSRLIATESLRTLDRLRLRTQITGAEIASRRSAILAVIASLELIEINATVLARAEQPMPTELGTLDAIHLASALLWREATGAKRRAPSSQWRLTTGRSRWQPRRMVCQWPGSVLTGRSDNHYRGLLAQLGEDRCASQSRVR